MELQSPCPPTTVRRNPPRKARKTPSTLLLRDPPPPAQPAIAPFPIDELLHPEPSQDPPLKPDSPSENLKVFLRIRPLDIAPKPGKNPSAAVVRKKGKGVSPKKLKGRNNNVCLVVNDSTSVTLSAPISLSESKRAKSEVYDGFSHVFPPDSLQKEVYESVMDPLVAGFMEGKSALLAALGPTGSGKTYTMFGCPRQPGLVPQALRKIFSRSNENDDSHLSRSYYLSMFEICSERGRGERILDLSPDGVELSLQQSGVKGLQEVMVFNLAEAESLVARGMLKRATAVTNANSQSSRSQCIINIRNARQTFDDNKVLPSGAVLTIADLAGAEKERKTGNQGARLLESNFINNTSMVFGLCLRSLLEHQKNPKKPLQKHFKNSLLTRYLREYLEGKRQMTLILTVKPGEDDYLDTSFLLRQASPYMKIKYSNLEEFPNLPCLKRTTAHSRSEHLKRRKFNGLDSSLGIALKNDDGVDDYHISEKEVRSEKLQEKKNASPKCLNTAHMRVKIIDNHHAETQRVRNDEVMCNFAKALWNVLKQYKQKLTESDKEIQKLKDALRKENTLVSKLEKELEELRSCSCCKHPSIENSPPKEEVLSTFSTTGSLMKSLEQESLKYIDGVHGFNSVEDDCDTLDSCISTDVSKGCQQPLFQNPGGEDVEANRVLLDERSSEGTLSPLSSPLVLGRTRVEENKMTGQMVDSFSKIKFDEESRSCPFADECLPSQTEVKPTDQKGESLPGKKHSVADLEEMNIHRAYLVSTSSENSDNLDRSLPPPVNLEDNENVQRPQFNEKVETCNTRNSSLSMDGEIMKKCHKVNSKSMPLLELHPAVVTDDGPSDESEARELSVKIQSPAFKPPNAGKPRIRKLVPASAMLLKEFSGLEVDVENAKENRSKSSTKGTERSQGSISLFRLLNSNVSR